MLYVRATIGSMAIHLLVVVAELLIVLALALLE